MIKKAVWAVCIVFFFGTVSPAIAEQWTLAAVPFTLSLSPNLPEEVEEAARSVPKLILDYLEHRGNRTMEESEIERRTLYELRQERQSLFNQLTERVTQRDSIMFSKAPKSERKKKTKEADVAIKSLQEQIHLNLLKAADPLGVDPSFKTDIFNQKKTVQYVSSERPGDRLGISVWRDDSTQLFDDKTENETSSAFEKRVVAENVSGLISGTVAERAGFVHVTVELRLFPGGEVVASIIDVGSIADVAVLAISAARELYSFVLNSKPVKLRFEISPSEAASAARVYVDGLLPEQNEDIIIENGKHAIFVYADGFESKDFSYVFTETDEYLIKIKMNPKKMVAVSISSQNEKGAFYTNALPVNTPEKTMVNAGLTMGEFVSESGNTDYFMLENRTERTDTPATSLVFKDISFKTSISDISADIEKSRTDMYNSYAALLFSLPMTFFANGMTIAANNSYLYGRGDVQEYENWKQYTTFTNALSLTLGANFLFQLGRYLYKANSILPKTVIIEEEGKTQKWFSPSKKMDKLETIESGDMDLKSSEK